MKIGLNLYSIRNLVGTEEEYEKTAFALKEMGYSYLQYSGAPYDPARIARVSEHTGLPVYLTHVPSDRIIGDTEKLMEEHASFGCRNIGLGRVPIELLTDETAWKKKIGEWERAAEKMEKLGFTFFYHNHQLEFLRYGGQTMFDYMVENAPHVHFTLDTYWVQLGGENILALLEKIKGRVECVHLKDYELHIDERGEVLPRFAPLGRGNLHFPDIVEKMRAVGVRYFFVEQDNAADMPDPLEQVKISVNYAQKL